MIALADPYIGRRTISGYLFRKVSIQMNKSDNKLRKITAELKWWMAVGAAAGCTLVGAQTQRPVQADADIPTQHQEVRGFLVFQGVNTRIGNFARTYPAFDQHALRYLRTYNSNTDNRGTFGLAWGSIFDTQVVPMPDGRVAVLENGNGALTVYGPGKTGETRLQLEQAVISALARSTDVPRPSIGSTLSIESAFAQSAAAGCENSKLTVLSSGYTRTTCAGLVEIFNNQGRIVGYTSSKGDGSMVSITRDSTGRIVSSQDEAGHKLAFSRTSTQLKITNERGDWVSYVFDPQGRNTSISGKREAPYKFDYGADGLMRQINYIDTTSIKIDYTSGKASRLTMREGDIYEFDYLPENQTRITQRPHNGTPSQQVVKFQD